MTAPPCPIMNAPNSPTCYEAQQEAVRLAGALIANNSKRMQLGEDRLIQIMDEEDLILFRLDFNIVGAAAVTGSNRKKNNPA